MTDHHPAPEENIVLRLASIMDRSWYEERAGISFERKSDMVRHYLTEGWLQGLDPCSLFDTDWYLERNPDVKAAGINPFLHYLDFGWMERRDPHPYFDTGWHMAQKTLLPGPTIDPLTDYYSKNREAVSSKLDPVVDWFKERGMSSRRSVAEKLAAKPIGVVFLARCDVQDASCLSPFFSSYGRFDPGVEHDLIIIRKGNARTPPAKKAISIMLGDANASYIDIEDDGYDIQAYIHAAATLKNEYLIFLNSHSEITASNWLKIYMDELLNPRVGLVGATGSYESISDTVGCTRRVVWQVGHGYPIADDVKKLFKDEIESCIDVVPGAEDWRVLLESEKFDGLFDEKAEKLDLDVMFHHDWLSATKADGPFHFHSKFPPFPNPHVRTNAFGLKRELLLSLDLDIGATREGCVLFESGPRSLTNQILARKLSCVLVGTNGQSYDIDNWASSNTFRSGKQGNALIADNRVKEYENASLVSKEKFSYVTWGRYANIVPAGFSHIGFPFEKRQLALSNFGAPPSEFNDSERDLSICIVIPTHNRLDLVKQAIVTIQAQDYPNWTCVVFDNFSQDPVEDYVSSLGDERVRYFRSDIFLPVTDSWNTAINYAVGDYVILIGDDDGFPPKAFSRLVDIASKFSRPDLVYSSMIQFIHPWVAPSSLGGHVDNLRNAFFLLDRNEPFILSKKEAITAVEGSLSLRRNFTFNMQACFFSKKFLDDIKVGNKVFLSPFPDYYLANVALVRSKCTVVVPNPISLQGVSKKSFGFNLLNDNLSRGDELLGTVLSSDPLYDELSSQFLPGSSYNTKFFITMKHVEKMVGLDLSCEVAADRYRKSQILLAIRSQRKMLDGDEEKKSVVAEDFWQKLSLSEQSWVRKYGDLIRRAKENVVASRALRHVIDQGSIYAPSRIATHVSRLATGQFESLPELYVAMRNGMVETFSDWQQSNRNI